MGREKKQLNVKGKHYRGQTALRDHYYYSVRRFRPAAGVLPFSHHQTENIKISNTWYDMKV